jgi:hypothetical protein
MLKALMLVLLLASIADAHMCPGVVGGTATVAGSGEPNCNTEVQSCATATNPTDSLMGATYRWKASKFVAGDSATICSISLRLKKTVSPTFSLAAYIYGSTGTEPDESSILGGSDSVDSASLSTSYAYISFTGMSAAITNTTEYWIVLVASEVGDASNYVNIRIDSGCDFEEGVKYSSNGTSWTNSSSTRGFNYYLYE